MESFARIGKAPEPESSETSTIVQLRASHSAAHAVPSAILRDARKSALLRMRPVFILGSFRGRQVFIALPDPFRLAGRALVLLRNNRQQHVVRHGAAEMQRGDA